MRIILSLLLCIILSALVFSDTWIETSTADFTAGAASNTQAINDSVSISAQSAWWDPRSDWWDTNWLYRKSITVNNQNSSALSDYQVKIINPVHDETGLVGSWHFSEALSDVSLAARDSSGMGNIGFFGGSDNLAPNPDFETGSPGSWSWAWGNAGTSSAWDSVTKYSGSYSLKQTHTVNTENSVWYGDTAFGSITPGRIYTVSAWIKTNGTGVGGARFWIGWDDAGGTRIIDKSNPGYYTTGNAWQYVTFTLDGTNVPPANTSRARIHLQHFSFLGDIWFDNVRLSSRYPARTASGKYGNGVSFDGVDDSIEVLDNTISGTAVDACDATAGWVKQGAGGSIVLNNSIYREGTGSLELLKSGATGTDSYFEKPIASTNMQGKLLNLWFYVRDAAALSKINRVELYLIAPAYSNYINKTPILPSTLKTGWNLLTFDTSFPTGSAGTPNLTNVQILRIDVDTNLASDLFSAGEIIMDNWFLTSGQPSTPSLRFGLNSAMTIESWIYPTDPAVVWRCFFQKGGISDNDANYVFRQYGSNTQFFYRGINNLWHYVGTLSDPLTINAWNHVAVSFIYGKPETMKLFVNGNSIPFVWLQGDGTITPAQNSDPVVFGGKNAFNQPFIGSMDETRLYNRALSSDEIKAHYDARVKPTYDDVRFVKPDGTELPYWYEQDGTFWVKISGANSIPQGISTIYAYYGNSSAASASNGTNTFALFDKFDSMSQWFTSYQTAILDTTYTYEGTYNARVKNDMQVETKIVVSPDPLIYEIKMYDDYFPKIACTSLPTVGTAYILGFNKNLVNNNYVYRVGGTWYDSGIVRTRAWHNLKQAWDGTNVAMYIDNTRVYGPAPTTDGVPLNYVFADYWLQSKSETCFDSFRARKYAALEPVTSAGSETGQSTQWPYRKAISISNPSSSLSDYQLAVKPFSLQRYEETDPACSYTGTWGTGSAVNHSNGAVKRSLTAGDYAVFTFSGTGVMWIGNKTTNRGIANVYIDDIFQYAVDCYEPLGLFQLALFTKTGLTDATHTLKVEVTNTKNTASTDYYISIDAFEVYTAANNDFINNNGIAGSWHFSQGSGNFAADSSGNNNDCVFYNQALRTIYTMTSSADSYAYIDLTGVTDYTIQAGDYLEYDLYWTSNSDYIAFDYICSDATTLRGSSALDQNGLNASPVTNISTQTLNQWYHRKIPLPGGHTGKIIQKYDAACEDNNSATRTAFFGNILITNGAGTTRKTIYAGGTPAYANDFVSNGVLSYITTNDSATMPVWTSGKFGNGVSFNGLLSYAEAADSASLDITHAITLEAWIKPSSFFSAVNNYVITKGLDSYVLACTDAGAISMSVYADGILRTVTGGSVPLSQWSHITGTYDSSTKQLRVYANGIFQNSLALSGLASYRINTNSSNLRIGFYEPGKGVNGVLDEVRVYSRALTDDEILAKYNLHQSKLNADYSDVRFIGNSGTELPYWMETDKTCWVRMIGRDAVPYGDSTLYMYYGNMSAKDAGNGGMTFDFFDDFNDSNYNTQWTNPSGTFTEANGYVQQTSDTGAAANEGTDELRSIAQIPASMASGGFVAQAGVYSGNSGSWNDIAGVIFTTQTATSLRYGNSSTDRLSLFNRYNSGADNGFGVDYKTSWIYTVGDSYLSGWNRISATFKGADGWDLKGYDINDTIMGSGNGLNETVITGPLYVRLHSYNNSTRWDNVFIHKYAAIEPSVSSAETEETPYLTAGSFTSAVKDTAANDSLINSIAWSVSGAGTITMQIRANNSPIGWTSSSPAWESVTNGDTTITSQGRYLQYKATFTGNGASSNPALTDITVTYTAPVTPPTDSVSCDKLSNTWYSTAVFTFTNDTGFGAQIDKYYYAWDNTSSYTFTLTEPVWNSSTPQLQNSSTSDGLWYFHYLPVSSTDTPGTAQDIGPYKYDGTAPAACVPLSPADNSNIASSVTTFVWQGSSDTSGITYTLQIDNYPDFSSLIVNKTYLTNTTYTLSGTENEVLVGNSTYYWRVLAVNGASNTSYMSNPSYYKFTTTSSVPQVTNESTGESFATLQDAIDSASTADNDTLTVNDSLAHNENISLTKDIILKNAILSPASGFAVTGQGALGGEILRNCVITSGGISDLALGENLTIFDAGSSTTMVIENSRLVNCLIEFGTTLTNCTLENCDLAATAEYFVDAANGDFHLTGTASLAIDQGKNLSSEFTTDIDGIVRNKDILEINNFDSGAWDIGAYEYDPETVYINPTDAVIKSSPSGLTYSTIEGSSADITKTLAISNAGTMDFDWIITDDAAWLTTTPPSGTGSVPTTVNVTANPSGLSAGLYAASITVTSAEASNSPLYVLVNLIVNSISSSGNNYALIEATPSGLSFYEQENTYVSSIKPIVISNAGTLDFNWSITDDAEWLSVSPETGISSESTSAEATATLTGLTAGSYSANITIIAEGALNNPLTIPVSLTIYETSDNSNNSGNTGDGDSNSNTSGVIPSTPLLYSPSKGLSNVYPAPILTWAPAEGSTNSISYWLQISTDAEFSNMLINKIIYSTSYQTTDVEFGRVYYWRVKAANNAGMSNWSETWEFQMSGQNEQTGGTNTKACFITKLKIKN